MRVLAVKLKLPRLSVRTVPPASVQPCFCRNPTHPPRPASCHAQSRSSHRRLRAAASAAGAPSSTVQPRCRHVKGFGQIGGAHQDVRARSQAGSHRRGMQPAGRLGRPGGHQLGAFLGAALVDHPCAPRIERTTRRAWRAAGAWRHRFGAGSHGPGSCRGCQAIRPAV